MGEILESSLPPLVHRFRTPTFRKWDHRAQRAAEARVPRVSYETRRVHAQIGHNEPNQPTSVHTIDNKPYIFEKRSLLRGRWRERRRSLSRNSGNVTEICYCCGRRRRLSAAAESRAKMLNESRCDLDDFLKRSRRFDVHITMRSVFYGTGTEERILRFSSYGVVTNVNI